MATMRARKASFLTSAAEPRGFPPETVPEIAIAGRSNVGKSSLINRLTGVQRLAKTSSTPGRTRLLNWFAVRTPGGTEVSFVDLPGYGYAKVSKSMRRDWGRLIETYLQQRDVLRLVVLLIDIRRGVQQEELELLEWCGVQRLPCQIVLTKGDKLPKSKRQPEVVRVRRAVPKQKKPLLTSAESGEGFDALWRVLESVLTED